MMIDFSTLNASTAEERLRNLDGLLSDSQASPERTAFVNNHIHTIYSFSPYSPTSAAYHAWLNGLATAGIMDHDSVSGAAEFLAAGRRIGISVTNGFECRCGMRGTPFETVRLNNPDQSGVAYVACHGIPRQSIAKADQWLAPYRRMRDLRNRAMTERLNALCALNALQLDYDRDILPLSCAREGGSVTERHILFALARKAIAVGGKGRPVVELLREQYGIKAQGKTLDILLNADDLYYDYRLLGVFKSNLVEKFYIDATDECPPILNFIAFVKEIGAISAYAYLGDVGDSVTGDKKTQVFEDAFLDTLMGWLKKAGFNAVTYMPTRNTAAQLERIMRLCREQNLFQICGEDINTPFQSFICKQLALPEYRHLADAAWALIGHELLASQDLENGMFTERILNEIPSLYDRIAHFAKAAKETKG
jgi:hypothetical protein